MAELEWDKTILMKQAGDDERLAGELLALFRDSSALDLQKIKEGLAELDSAAVSEAAHSIKGSAVSLGIEGIGRIASRVEQFGREHDLEKAVGEFDDLEALLKEIDKQV
ncbi:MAG: Hpt domain-containing protein [Desulfurivibrionaceae bacterium]